MKKNQKRNRVLLVTTTLASAVFISYATTTSFLSFNNGTQKFQQQNFVSLTSSVGDSTTKYFFKPSSIVVENNATKWSSEKYASQITSNDIKKILNFDNITTPNSEEASESSSGYTFEEIGNGGTRKRYLSSDLESAFGYQLGNKRISSIASLIINITKVDNAKGEVFFKVYQPLQGYTMNTFGEIDLDKPDSEESSPYKKLTSLITPPTKYASSEDTLTWKLPTHFPVKKVEYIFSWAPEQQISNFVETFGKPPSSVTQQDIVRNFFTLSTNFKSNDSLNIIPPQPTSISLVPNNQVSKLDITIQLPVGYKQRTYRKTLFGFQKVSSQQNNTILNLATNQELLNSTVQMPYWDVRSAKITTFIDKKVSELLPSQLVKPNYNGINFLDVFTGAIRSAQTLDGKRINNKTALAITGNENAIGYLTYQGFKSGSSELVGLPQFKIKEITTYPNDQDGTLLLIIKYDTISNDGTIVEAPLATVSYTGFAKNTDSGQLLYFSWKNIMPSKYASFTAEQIVQNFRQLGTEQERIDPNNYYNTIAAKAFVASFFDSSSYMSQKYNKDYFGVSNNPSASPSLYDGARVKVSNASTESDDSSDRKQKVLVSIQFAIFNGIQNYTIEQTFKTSHQESDLPSALKSSIKINPVFLKSDNKYSSLLASQLTLDQIKSLFILEIPDIGKEYTSSLEEAVIFAIPDDKTGKLAVSIIFPKFNSLINYEYNTIFYNFKQNLNLQLNLQLGHTQLQNLSATFLAIDPLNEQQLTKEVVMEEIFGEIDAGIFRILRSDDIIITERTKDYIVVQVSVDWTKLIENFNTGKPENIANRIALASSESDEKIEDIDKSVITFKISGFTGGDQFTPLNDTPYVPQAILSNFYIMMIGVGIFVPILLAVFIFAYRFIYQNRKYKKLILELEKEENEVGE